MRTTIDLSESDCEALDALSRQLGISRVETVRRAVSVYLKAHQTFLDHDLFGIWQSRNEDALRYEDRIRAEWHRR